MVRERTRRTVTGRTLVLGAVTVLMLVLLASPVHRYFASRAALNNAASQLQQDSAALTRERQQLAKWNDPGYVQEQARLRLQYAMPGDTVFEVIRPDSHAGIDPRAGKHEDEARGKTWNTRLWSSVRAAGS